MVPHSAPTPFRQLAPGEFIGTADRRLKINTGVVAVMGRQKNVGHHEHSDTHFVLVLEGNYRTSAEGAEGIIRAGQVLLNTPGTPYDDQFVGRGSLIIFSIAGSVFEQFAAEERFTHPARRIPALASGKK